MTNTTLVREFSSLLTAIGNCEKSANTEWLDRHSARMTALEDRYLPHGSGIDGAPCRLDVTRSKPNRLVFAPADFHHMNDCGMYDGWTEHEVIVTPSLAFGVDVRITGRDRSEIKDYLREVFEQALTREIDLSTEYADL
jgi:hypothetical protein